MDFKIVYCDSKGYEDFKSLCIEDLEPHKRRSDVIVDKLLGLAL